MHSPSSPAAGRSGWRGGFRFRTAVAGLSLFTSLFGVAAGDVNPPSRRPTLMLEGTPARLTLDLAGGSITGFRLKDSPLDPLNWGAPRDSDLAIRGFGHFLCLDRWGPPSEAEGARGMPYHGEAAHVAWSLDQEPKAIGGYVEAMMSAPLPLAGLSVRRNVRLSQAQPVARVREDITNDRPLGRIFNIVQHPTIAPPFLDESTLVDSNGRRGFAQGSPTNQPGEPALHWPMALNRDGEPVNLRTLTDDPDPNVVTFAIEDRHGWVTAANPGQRLLIGYLWKTSDYPWISVWRDVKNGKPAARGLEFGSTGVHQPYPILVRVGRLWDRPLFEYLDAGETRTKSYLMFLIQIPGDFKGVNQVTLTGNQLVVRERATSPPREFKLDLAEALQP